MRRPARQHHPRRQPPAPIPSALELALHQLEDLVHALVDDVRQQLARRLPRPLARRGRQVDQDRKSTRLNSSHTVISYAVFCLKKKGRAIPQSFVELCFIPDKERLGGVAEGEGNQMGGVARNRESDGEATEIGACEGKLAGAKS